MKIILTGEYTKWDSIQIYTENIIKHLDKNTEIEDQRIEIPRLTDTNISLRKKIKYLIKSEINTIHRIKKIKSWWTNVKIALSQTHYFLYKCIKSDVVIVHDLFYLDYYKQTRNIFLRMIYYILFNLGHNYFLRKHKHIVAISQKTKNKLIKIWIPKDKITIIYNWIDHNIFIPTKKKKKKQILCVGMEYPRKNLKNSIKAFEKLIKEFPDYQLIKLWWFENSKERKEIIFFIKNYTKLKIGQNIIFKNMVSREELIKFYQESKLLLFPSFEEGFWFPIIEAQACWCPVITSNIWPMNELIPYKEMLVNPNDIEDIVKSLRAILSLKKGIYDNYMLEWVKFSKNFDRKLTMGKIKNLLF